MWLVSILCPAFGGEAGLKCAYGRHSAEAVLCALLNLKERRKQERDRLWEEKPQERVHAPHTRRETGDRWAPSRKPPKPTGSPHKSSHYRPARVLKRKHAAPGRPGAPSWRAPARARPKGWGPMSGRLPPRGRGKGEERAKDKRGQASSKPAQSLGHGPPLTRARRRRRPQSRPCQHPRRPGAPPRGGFFSGFTFSCHI
jgi:hypothetical protein